MLFGMTGGLCEMHTRQEWNLPNECHRCTAPNIECLRDNAKIGLKNDSQYRSPI